MINYLMVGTNRFEAAVAFYDALMAEMGATRVYAVEKSVAWGFGPGTPMFIVTRPFDEQRATIGNGSMVAFDVDSAEKVDALHAKVLALGGTSEGDPGPRGEQLYVGYWRDLDGNKFNFIHYKPQNPGA
ncbi:MAG TPA: VOC family protein [Steroidobacteraceae bacterium]|nr:VOC family protein [Steroidobacteraceae bacterium]